MSNRPHTHRPQAGTRKKVLFLHSRFPYPIVGGDRLKAFYALKHLAANHDVTFVSFYHGGEAPPEYVKVLSDLGIDVHTLPLNPIRQGLNCIANVAREIPLEISFYQHPAYQKLVHKLHAEKKFDVAFGFFMRAAEYLRSLNVPKVLIAEDCRLLYTHRSLSASKALHQKFARWFDLGKLAHYEPKIFGEFDRVTFVTNEDIQAAKALNPNVDYRLLTNGVSSDQVAPFVEQENRKDILFAGKLDVWANTVMAHTVAERILPIIHSMMPNVHLHIAGGFPPASVKKLQSEFVHIHADVPDLREYMRNAAVFVHPHSAGSGIQNKLLEAMSSGCAVVTTPTGIQGIPAWHDREVMIGMSDEEMARYTVALLTDIDKRTELCNRATELVEQQFAWDSVLAPLDELIQELTSPGAVRAQLKTLHNFANVSSPSSFEDLSLNGVGKYKPVTKKIE